MTKLLDLDALPTRDLGRTIKLNGVKHPMRPMALSQFIETQKLVDAIEQSGTIADQVGAVIDQIVGAFPSIKRSELLALDMDKLDAIFNFLTADQPKAEDVAATGEFESPAVG